MRLYRVQLPIKKQTPRTAHFQHYTGHCLKNTDKKKGAPPGGTNKPGGDMNISKSDIQGHYYYITSKAICQALRKKTPDQSRAFSPKGVKQESQAVQGKPPHDCASRGGMAKKILEVA